MTYAMKVKSVNHQNKTRFIDIAKLEPKKKKTLKLGIK